MALGDVRSTEGDHGSAIRLYEEGVELRRGLGDPVLISDAIYNLGLVAFLGGDRARARAVFEESLRTARELAEAPYIAAAQFMLAELDLLAGDPAGSVRARESLALYSELEDDRSRARCLALLACAAALNGSLEEAARILGAAQALRGNDEPDIFEKPILDLCREKLEAGLGPDRLARLLDDGEHGDADAVAREVVATTTQE
jgi:tetratricopeptide (TPR) repeat protein